MTRYKVTGNMTFRFTARASVLDIEYLADAIADAIAAGDYELDDMRDYELDFECAEPVDGHEPEHDRNAHVHPIMREALKCLR